jgi:ribosomal protein S12 methylthiotransferase accessory factor
MFLAELLQPAPKAGGSFDRCVSLDATLTLVPWLCERYGITRIADITHLDRIGIPVMSAIVPDSPDAISVYNGKGPTRECALAGAVMEAVERQVAAAPGITRFEMDGYDAVDGLDLLSGAPVFVPLGAVQCPWYGTPAMPGSSTDGLAAGNTLAEAVYHALCEVTERHLWSIAHATGHLRPQAIVTRFAGRALRLPNFIDDAVATEIILPTGSAVIDSLAEKVHRAGLVLRLRAVEADPLPILLVATIGDPLGGPSSAHTGLGCSLSPEHAAIRAITEAAQGRAADFLGAREDLQRHDDETVIPYGAHRTYGLPLGRWYYDAPAPVRSLRSYADRSTTDVARDLHLLIEALRSARAGPVAVVDLSPTDLPIHVVRAVAIGFDLTIPSLLTDAKSLTLTR